MKKEFTTFADGEDCPDCKSYIKELKKYKDPDGTYIGFTHHMQQVAKLRNDVEYYFKQRNEFAASYEVVKDLLLEAAEFIELNMQANMQPTPNSGHSGSAKYDSDCKGGFELLLRISQAVNPQPTITA